MRATKCDQEQVNRTLRSRVRAQNEGKFGVFECDIFLTYWYITLNISKSIKDRSLRHVASFSPPLTCPESMSLTSKLPSIFPGLYENGFKVARRARAHMPNDPQQQKFET